MHPVEFHLTVRSLAELALLASRAGRDIIDHGREPSLESLRIFGQQTRALQKHWTGRLNEWSSKNDPQFEILLQTAEQLFLCEMVSRVWTTVLLGIDQKTGRNDLTKIGRNVVGGLLQVRNSVLWRLTVQPIGMQSHIAKIEQLRRRSDRWTDLLIGNLAGSSDLFEFAFEKERARDFAIESIGVDPCSGPSPVEYLLTAGLRIAFLEQLSSTSLQEPAFLKLIESIFAALPSNTLDCEETLRLSREQRALAKTLPDKSSLPAWLVNLTQTSIPQTNEPCDTIPFPGPRFGFRKRYPR